MHSNATNTRRLSYAAIFGRDGLPARHMVKLLMAALMVVGMVTQVQAEGNVYLTREKTGFWAVLFSPSAATSTATSAAVVCEAVGKSAFGVFGISVVFVGTSPNATYFAGYEALNCLFRDSVTGITLIQNAVFPVTRAVCPPNSSPGMPCTCNATYKPDPTITQCIPVVLYTIALHNLNLGGELKISASRAAYAQVKEGAVAKSGIAVTLTTTAPPEAGTATLSPSQGTTDAEGKFNFTFNAPPVAGTHTVTAKCDGGKCSNEVTGTIGVTACPVKDLTPLDELSKKFGETPEQVELTNKLESGMDGYSLLSDATKTAEQCLAGRINTVIGPPSISGYKVTSTVRTLAYQKHLREVWDKFLDLQKRVKKDPTIQQTCQTLIAKVEGEMGLRLTQDPQIDDCTLGRAHCVRYPPAQTDPKHTQNIAFDIPLSTVEAFVRLLKQPPPSTVQQEANACGLNWGGIFASPDRIHFLLR